MDQRALRPGRPRGARAAMTGAALGAVLVAALLAFGCGEAATTDEGPPPATASPLTAGGGGEGLTDVSSGAAGADGTSGEAGARAEIERRLALPRSTYVAETDYKQSGQSLTYKGALAIVDSETDRLAHRPR